MVVLVTVLHGLRNIVCEMHKQVGQPLTSYKLRPGADSLRVWQNFNDASRRDDTFFGAAGGWFRLWGSAVVFFFAYKWDPN